MGDEQPGARLALSSSTTATPGPRPRRASRPPAARPHPRPPAHRCCEPRCPSGERAACDTDALSPEPLRHPPSPCSLSTTALPCCTAVARDCHRDRFCTALRAPLPDRDCAPLAPSCPIRRRALDSPYLALPTACAGLLLLLASRRLHDRLVVAVSCACLAVRPFRAPPALGRPRDELDVVVSG